MSKRDGEIINNLEGEREELKKIEINAEILRRLTIQAQIVGGDFNMRVEISEPGQGSSFNPIENKIVFDLSQFVKADDPRLSELVEELEAYLRGLSSTERVKKYHRIFPKLFTKYFPILNVEDLDVERMEFISGHEGGHRAISRGPRAIGIREEKILDFYSKIGFAFMQNVIEDPAANAWSRQKFEGLEEIYGQEYSKIFKEEGALLGLDHPDVKKAMERLGYIPRFVRFGSEIIRYWHEGRFSQELDPEVERALGKVKESFKKSYCAIPGPKLQEAEVIEKAKERFVTNYEKVWPEFERIVKLDLLDEAMRQMMEAKRDEVMRKIGEQLKKELREKMRRGQPRSNGQEEDKDSQAGEAGGRSLPIGELSEELKNKLREIYDSLSDYAKGKLRSQAVENLGEIEDILNKEVLSGKINHDAAPTHKEIQDELAYKEQETENRRRDAREAEERKKIIQKAELETGLSDYDKYYREVRPLIESLYARLAPLFKPSKRRVESRRRYAFGSRLDLLSAMQFDADKSQYDKLFRKKDHYSKRDYCFYLIVDLSASMNNYGKDQTKIRESFKGLIIVSNVLERIDIPFEIIGYGTVFPRDVKKYKEFCDKLADREQKISEILKDISLHSYTPTSSATRYASERLAEMTAKEKFIINITDGKPNRKSIEDPEEIEKTNKETNKVREKGQKIAGAGIGPEEQIYYLKDLYKGYIIAKNEQEFSVKLADLLEDMIKNPQKY